MFVTDSAKKPLSPHCVHGVVTVLSSIFQSAYKAGIVKENPIRRTTPPKYEGKATSAAFLDEEQARQFIELLDKQPQGTYKAAFFVMLYVGLRSGELRALHWEDIDLGGGLLYVRHGLYEKNGEYTLTPPKNNSSIRALKLPQDVIDVLTDYKAWQDEQAAALGSRWTDNNIVFPNTRRASVQQKAETDNRGYGFAGHTLAQSTAYDGFTSDKQSRNGSDGFRATRTQQH
jgi:integrase